MLRDAVVYNITEDTIWWAVYHLEPCECCYSSVTVRRTSPAVIGWLTDSYDQLPDNFIDLGDL